MQENFQTELKNFEAEIPIQKNKIKPKNGLIVFSEVGG